MLPASAQENVQVNDYRTDQITLRLTCKSEGCTAQIWNKPKTAGQGTPDKTWEGGQSVDGVDDKGECGYHHVIFTPYDPKIAIQLTTCSADGAPKDSIGKLIQTLPNGKLAESWLFKSDAH